MRKLLFLASALWLSLAPGLTARSEDCPCGTPMCEQQSSLCDECGGCCECDECCSDCQRFLGLLPSDHGFDRFISPLSNPFYFEDPRSLTEVRGVFLDNRLPSFVGNGEAQVWAAQFRGRLTDRMSVIAPRVAYFQLHPDGPGAPSGIVSAPVGFKYNFIADEEEQLLVSGGMTYFIPGSSQTFSNFGDGDFHFFLTAGKEIFDRGHWLSAAGFRIPADDDWGTQLFYWSNQWDYEVANHWYGLLGVNWFHWMRNAGNNIGAPVTGLDLLNLPVNGVAGNDVVSGVVGVKWKPSGYLELGAGYEFPLTDRTDILRDRVYADLIFRY